ncbi:MAG TPA: hypothetical protein VGC41_08515 [Kofleriaceae bacterium]
MFEKPDALVVVLADGADGTSRGASAAQAIVDAVAAADTDGCDLLGVLDGDPKRLGQGQATAVIISPSASGIAGASVGDSGAWLVAGGNVHELTAGQVRKPLVGDGCMPVAFSAGPLGPQTLLVASDRLFNYAKRADIVTIVNGPDLEAAAAALVQLVRLPSGNLADDVSVVLARPRMR